MSREQALAGMRPQLMRYAMYRLRDRHRAEDAVQEALVAALEGIARFGGASSLRTWVGGILKHKIADCLRAAGREEPLDMEVELPGSDPEERFRRRRFFEALEQGLGQLPGSGARVFMMREVLGFDTMEASRALGISASHCCVTLHRAKARLRALAPNEI